MTGHLFLDMPSIVVLGIVETQMQLAMSDIRAAEHAGEPMEESGF
jgi:hypothetical protein